MAKFIIQGGKPLKGVVRVGGAKNASFKLIIASLLASGESRLLDVSKVGDVEITKKIIKALGGGIESRGERTVFIQPDTLRTFRIPQELGIKSRASTMFAGPLLACFGKADLPLPGGDKIGPRPLDRHIAGLESLGVKASLSQGILKLRCQNLKGAHYRFVKNTHTGTETLIMAAVKAKGATILENAALEPEIDDLIAFLNKMGAKIKRLSGRVIKIEGVRKLGGAIYRIMPDRNEAVSYACAALATQGDVTIENARAKDLAAFLDKVKQAGGNFEVDDFGIRFWYEKPLKATDITTAPHPGFMTDWQPLWTLLMTQAKGKSTIIEAVHSWRLRFAHDLVRMRAKIELFNPKISNPDKFYNFNLKDDKPEYFHAARVSGPTSLKGTDMIIPNIRAGATLTLAALIARGKSTLSGIEHIDRGYENLDGRLQELGANIKRVN